MKMSSLPQPEQQPRSDQTVKKILRTLGFVAASWVLDSCILLALAYLTATSYHFVGLYFLIGIGFTGLFACLVKQRVTLRSKDPALSYFHLFFASLNHALGLWLAPQIGFFFLLNIFQVFAYGLFSLTTREFRNLLLATSSLMVVPIIYHGEAVSFPLDSPMGKALLVATFFLALARFVLVENYVGVLRRKVAAKSRALSESEARFRALTELSSDWFWEQDEHLIFTTLESGRGRRALPEGSVRGRHPWENGFEIELDGGWEQFRNIASARKEYHDLVLRKELDDGTSYFVSLSGAPFFDGGGAFLGYRGVARDITEQRLAAGRIEYLATHDALTGLANRFMFNQLLGAALESAWRNDRRLAVMFIDLDGFKRINDTLGHHIGDELLKVIAGRFKGVLRSSDIVARLGGDEFVVLVQETEHQEQLMTVAEKILAAALKPVIVAGQECRVSASIGVALFPEHGDDKHTLMKHADIAMYQAKEHGKNNCRIFGQSENQTHEQGKSRVCSQTA
jgi:diguanylate cyclase (GGDEF)-like protein/PAS domain S-box-containing protein